MLLLISLFIIYIFILRAIRNIDVTYLDQFYPYNRATRKAMRDADLKRNLLEFKSVDEMFKVLLRAKRP